MYGGLFMSGLPDIPNVPLNTSGFWLVHSVPKYPPPTDREYSWNYLGSRNGQLFLCVTFSYDQLGLIAYQLFMNQPQIYDHNIPDDIGADYPLLNLIVKGKKPSGPQWYNITQLTSSQGLKVISFAKSDDYGEDLYESLLAPNLKTSLKVETWLNGKGTKLPSNCTLPYQVINIRAVALSEQASFNETKDHSKWAVSAASGIHFISEKLQPETHSPWVCVADINRMESQFKRGGGAMCLQHPQVWAAFTDVIDRADSCQSRNA
ncbi:Plancitoxin-1 [Bulinus truncatus]|nr:Plancitoxin-1 [Bulinus truncatus]